MTKPEYDKALTQLPIRYDWEGSWCDMMEVKVEIKDKYIASIEAENIILQSQINDLEKDKKILEIALSAAVIDFMDNKPKVQIGFKNLFSSYCIAAKVEYERITKNNKLIN